MSSTYVRLCGDVERKTAGGDEELVSEDDVLSREGGIANVTVNQEAKPCRVPMRVVF